ncbi:MAG: protein TolR [Betaproteobacteria bacterium]|jgi:biopolymer transport protein TolR|nr:protein TolR [Betaproteobacteria bacterium]
MSEINVVPYIDVMLVLLIIFMVCAPLITPGQIDLPSVGQALNPTVAPLEIRIGKDGGITLVDRQQGGREQSVGKTELLASVKTIQARHADQAVVISADKDLRYEVVISVLDTLQKGQVKRVGLLAKPAA